MKGRGVEAEVSDEQYRALLEFRDALRRFLRWSETEARAVGLTPTQHQLLLVVRASPSPPSLQEVADHLLLRHHSVVGLVDRAEAAGLVERRPDPDDQRVVRVALTAAARRRLERLTQAHLAELDRQIHWPIGRDEP